MINEQLNVLKSSIGADYCEQQHGEGKNLLLIREKLAEKAKPVFVNGADKQNMYVSSIKIA